eukprot:8158534-Lingulodinium_polyedra.AAC.1
MSLNRTSRPVTLLGFMAGAWYHPPKGMKSGPHQESVEFVGGVVAVNECHRSVLLLGRGSCPGTLAKESHSRGKLMPVGATSEEPLNPPGHCLCGIGPCGQSLQIVLYAALGQGPWQLGRWGKDT